MPPKYSHHSASDLLQEKFFQLVTTHSNDFHFSNERKSASSSSSSSLEKIQQFCYAHSDTININARDENSRQRTGLMLAVLHLQLPIVEYLVSAQGADANIEDCQNFSALHFCSGGFSLSTSPSQQQQQEELPYFFSRQNNNCHSKSQTLLFICYFLICFGKNTKIDARTWDHFTPLALACFSGNVEVAKMLIAFGANPEVKCGKNCKNICEIAEQEHPHDAEICKFLRQENRPKVNHQQDQVHEDEEFYSPAPKNRSSQIGSASPSPGRAYVVIRTQQYASPQAERLAASVCEPVETSNVVDFYSHHSPYNNSREVQHAEKSPSSSFATASMNLKIISKMKVEAQNWFQNWKLQNLEKLEQMEKRQEIYLEERIRNERRNLKLVSMISSSSNTSTPFCNNNSGMNNSNNNNNADGENPNQQILVEVLGEELLKRKKILSAFRAVLNIFLVPPESEDIEEIEQMYLGHHNHNQQQKNGGVNIMLMKSLSMQNTKAVVSSSDLFVSRENAVAAIFTFLPRISPKSIVLMNVEKKANGRQKLRAEEVEEIVDLLTS